MERTYRVTVNGIRKCNRCDACLPLNEENFIKDLSRPLGFAYECRPCHRARKRAAPPRPYIPTARRTPKQQDAVTRRSRNYYRTGKGRAACLAGVYRKIDKRKGLASDITQAWMLENIITKPCIYCGTTEELRGCDRVDNSIGHTMANCVPCCGTCNVTRMDHFTFDEMKVIGKVIAEVRAARHLNGYASGDISK